ncbi:hypothetical protein H8D91_01875, partial [archaeon]|nr:hypothetical protein [archaeon]
MLIVLPAVSATSIYNWTDLNNVRNNLAGSYTLENDLTTGMADYDTYASSSANGGAGWVPIGSSASKFTGSFNGQNHTIDGLFISRSGTDYVGLFGYAYLGSISNVGLTNVNITATNFVGSFAGASSDNIDRVYSTGKIVGADKVGGITGYNVMPGIINNTYSNANVTGSTNVGGISGTHSGYGSPKIYNSYFTGIVTGSTIVGGITGSMGYGPILDSSFVTGSVSGTSSVGSVVGTFIYSTLTNSYWYNHAGNPSSCVGTLTGSVTCTAKTDITWFYNVSNGPMSSWDFTSDWSNYFDGVTFPVFQWQLVPQISFVGPLTSGNLSQNYIESNLTSTLPFNATTSTINRTLYYVNGTLVSSNSSTTSPFYENISSLTEGTYILNATTTTDTGFTSSTSSTTILLDTTYPLINYSSVGTEGNNTNISQDWIYVNVSLTETNLANITYSLWNSSEVNTTTYTTNTSTSINWTGLADGTYTYNVTTTDLAGNTNQTETRTIALDTVAPTFSNIAINYTTDINNSIDPGSVVRVTLNVSDSFLGVSDVILQIYNGTWENYTMVSLTSNISNSEWQYNFTTQATDATYTFNVFANDTVGNINTSTNTTFYSYWDCTWNVSTNDLGTIGGHDAEVALGNVTITNTGDSQYGTNNCSITFSKTAIVSAWDWWANFSGTYVAQDFDSFLAEPKRGLNYSYNGAKVTSLVVNASESKTLEISAMFPSISGTITEYPSFPIAASITDSESGT